MSVRWSDEELSTAVAAAKSWRGVARALGHPGNSSGAIRKMKRRSAEIGLSVAHFTGQRRWTDNELRRAIASSSSWSEVARELSLSDSGDVRMRLYGPALRLRIDVSHLDPPAQPAPAFDLGTIAPRTKHLHAAAEPLACAWFTLCGLPTAVPTQYAPYDLLVTFPDGVKRVQVKSSIFKAQEGSWRVGIGQRPYVLDKTASRVPYDPDSLDYFFVVDGDGVMYLIPIGAVAGRTTISVGAYGKYVVGSCADLLGGAVTASGPDALMDG